MLKAASDLYRLAVEQQKPDAQRDIGYQDRDLKMFEGRLKRLEKSFAAEVDLALWTEQLGVYLAQPAALRVAALDQALGLDANTDMAALTAKLQSWYQQSSLSSNEGRLSWLGKTPADFQQSNDPFIKAAVALFDSTMAFEKQQKELTRMHASGDYSISDLAELFSVSRPTVYRTLQRARPGIRP